MSGLTTFLWGLGGAAIGYIVVGVLPFLKSKAEGKSIDTKWGWLFIYMMIYSLVGGFLAVAFIGGNAEPKHAVSFVMSGVTMFRGGFGEGLKLTGDTVKRRKP